jgi:uracil-DNA glycosylase family 4
VERETAWERLQEKIVSCEACPRLREWCREVAVTKRAQYREETYWGRPVPGFGDRKARLVILGLAPGAHGANRTGRVFTGDESGNWLYEALHRFGFANQPTSTHREDGLVLTDAFINNIVRCAPPQNKPVAAEMAACQGHLVEELALLTEKKVVLALGQVAFQKYLQLMKEEGCEVKGLKFGHMALYEFGKDKPKLLCSYHPSQQNTFTGKLTREMWYGVFETARRLLEERA